MSDKYEDILLYALYTFFMLNVVDEVLGDHRFVNITLEYCLLHNPRQ